MIEVFLATQNEGKVREIKEILRRISEEIGEEVVVVLPAEKVSPPEKGQTYFENALSKAMWWIEEKKISIPVVAEDSGLEIFALSKYPGVKSARVPHPDATDKDRCLYILNKMQGITERHARYVSCAVIYLPEGFWFSAEGKTYGTITDEMRGENGFGYDPIFLSDELGKTFGEVSLEEKTSVSHRWRAFSKLKSVIQKLKK